MTENEHHTIQLVKTYPSGAEEWHCPTCGRRFIMQWPPEYKKIVLEVGDEYAIHNGGKGGLSMNPPRVENHGQESNTDQSLNPWLEWINKTDLSGRLDQSGE